MTTNVHVGGRTSEQFKPVQEAFRRNFCKGWEQEGAALAVYHKGELVVDLWGGYADRESGRKWQQDTMTVVFSSTKALCALAVLKLVDEGRLNYDDLVTKHWPEFGQNGKDKVTVFELVSHMAGLVVPDEKITQEHIHDWSKMGQLFEKQKPNWPLGQGAVGYHVLTYGFPIDQLVRRVDTKRRSVGQYIQEDLIKATGPEEFYLGLPLELEHRVARNKPTGLGDLFHCAVKDRDMTKMILKWVTGQVPLASKGANCIEGLHLPIFCVEWHNVEIGACNGIGTARGLAQPLSALASGALIKNKKFIEKIKIPVYQNKKDRTGGYALASGHGFMYTTTPAKNNGTCALCMSGWGGQHMFADFNKQISFAYITNSLKITSCYRETCKALIAAVYECVQDST